MQIGSLPRMSTQILSFGKPSTSENNVTNIFSFGKPSTSKNNLGSRENANRQSAKDDDTNIQLRQAQHL